MVPQLEYVLRTVEERGVRFVQLWFTDVLGALKGFAITPAELEGALEEGMSFDGSAIEGYSRVQESDMLAMPDPSTFEIVPWRGDDAPVARMFCDIRTLAGEPVRRRPTRRPAPQPRAGARARLHVLRRPRDRVLLLRVGHGSDPARQRRLLRPHPHRQGQRAPPPHDPHARGDGHPRGVLVPRERSEPARDRPALHRRAVDGRQRDDVPHGGEAHRERARRARHVHAQADRGRVRLRPARAPLALRGRRQRVPRPGRRGRACRRRASTSSPGCCATHARSPRSPTRP